MNRKSVFGMCMIGTGLGYDSAYCGYTRVSCAGGNCMPVPGTRDTFCTQRAVASDLPCGGPPE